MLTKADMQAVDRRRTVVSSTHHARPFFNRALFLLFVLLLIWAPLPLGSNRPWLWALLEVWVFALGSLALLGWAVSPGMFRGGLRQHRLVLFLLLLWLVYLGLQMVLLPLPVLEFLAPANAQWWLQLPAPVGSDVGRLAASMDAARTEGLKHCAYTVFFCLTLLLVDSNRRLRLVSCVLIGTATFEAVYGLAAHFMRDSFHLWTPAWYGHNWPTGTFINKNHYAANLSFGAALTLGFCLAFLSRQRQRTSSTTGLPARLTEVLLEPGYLNFGLLLVLLTALFFSQSRGAFLGLVAATAGLLVFGVYWREYHQSAGDTGRSHSAEKQIVPWLFFTALAAALWLSGTGLFGRLSPSALMDMGRVITWRQSLHMWLDHWFFGVGNGGFQYVFTRYRVPELDGRHYDFVHNDHLQLLVELGVIGSVLFFAVFGWCWFTMLRAYCSSDGRRNNQCLLLGIMIAVSAFFLHGFVDFNFHIPANALWFYTLLAMGLVASARITRLS